MESIPDSKFWARLEHYWMERERLESRLVDPDAVRRIAREGRLQNLNTRLIPDMIRLCAG